ncbi:glycosyltransferase family 4 protein [Myceligenerans halotolerans]
MTTVLLAHASAELYGSDLQLVETATALREAGAKVVVALPQHGPLVEELRNAGAGVEIVDMPVLRKAHLNPRGVIGLFLHTVRATPRMVGIVRRHRPHVVVVNTVTIPAWLGISRFAGVAPVCHVHEAEADAPLLVRIGLNAPLLLARDVVVNSETARDVVVGAVPPLRRRTRIIYNGVPGPDGGPGPGPASTPGSARVVLVGRLSPRKGTDVALEAVGRLRQDGRDVRLTLCGTAFDGYEWFEDELRARASLPDLAGAVDFVGYADPWEWFARAVVVVVPSRVEPFGNVAVQALRAERPLVVSRTQGLAEIVRDGETGLSVPPGDPAALAGAVAELLDDPERAATLAAAGRKDAQERFGVERYRSEMARAILSPRA